MKTWGLKSKTKKFFKGLKQAFKKSLTDETRQMLNEQRLSAKGLDAGFHFISNIHKI